LALRVRARFFIVTGNLRRETDDMDGLVAAAPRVFRRVVFTLMCMTCTSAVAWAQAITNSGLAGVVRDETGAVLPGVTVEAASPALIEKVRTTVTDGQGRYQIIELRPGTYTLTFTLPGFRVVKRQDLTLTANFTATVNVELKVGSLDETITVSGQSPVVDVRNVRQKDSIPLTVLDTIPTARSQFGFVALIPAAIIPTSFQDVGGNMGEASTRISIHGSKAADQKFLLNGMRYNTMSVNGAGKFIQTNPAGVQEFVVQSGSGGVAEDSTGGVQVNVVSKDGGNRFSGYFFTAYTGEALQADNLTDELKTRGLKTVNKLINLHDINGALGGPLKRNKLWFYTAHRKWGSTLRWANQFYNANPTAWTYTPDPNRPFEPWDTYRSSDVNATWQALQKHKFNFVVVNQNNDRPFGPYGPTLAGTIQPEAFTGFGILHNTVYQTFWNYPASNKLLFSGGWTWLNFDYNTDWLKNVSRDTISVFEQSRGYRYRAPEAFTYSLSSQANETVSMTYFTGPHQLKAGLFVLSGTLQNRTDRNPAAVSYTFSNGVPIQLTQFVSPTDIKGVLSPELGLYAQDQWALRRLTLSFGLRFEYLRSHVPASEQPAGLLVGARSFAKVDCVPCWKDLNPRVAASYDLFGDGRTALKASIGRFVSTQTTDVATANNPVVSSINQTTRSWTDRNADLTADCDLRNSEANGECGRMANVNFGRPNPTTTYDSNYLQGWGNRDSSWQASAQIQHEIRPGMSVNGGYYRTSYTNFVVTDNLSVNPQDFDPYCLTAPSDVRLPGGGGQRICGLYNIKPAKFGLVNSLVTFASNYGKQTAVYNGGDLDFRARFSGGALLAGGVNVGNAVTASSGSFTALLSSNRCFVVDSPQELYQCDLPVPYTPQYKVYGSYPLPLDFQLSGNFQSLPGATIAAIYPAPTAQIAPELGRPLAGGAGTALIPLINPYDVRENRINQLDLRLTKIIRIRALRIQGMLDLYNVLNASPVLAALTTYGPRWSEPTQILDARLLKFGVQVEF